MISIFRALDTWLHVSSGSSLFVDELLEKPSDENLTGISGETLSSKQQFEYEITKAAWNYSEILEGDPDISAMINRCKNDIYTRKYPTEGGRLFQPLLIGGVAMVFVIVVIFNNIYLRDAVKAEIYSTDIAEQNTIELNDGTSILLNSNTRITVNYNKSIRKIVLDKGEAFFDVMHEEDRPFLVYARKGVIRVVGTEFNVDSYSDEVTVSVMSGVVSVKDLSDDDKNQLESVLKKGQAVTYDDKQKEHKKSKAEVSRIEAWKQGKIIYEATPLYIAIDEQNRYSSMPIVLEGESLYYLRISGTYFVGDTRAFIFSLKNMFDIVVEYKDDHVLVRSGK